MVRATDMKWKASGPLADIVGKKAQTRGAMVKSVWKHIKKYDCQGTKGDTAKYNGKTYKGGQVIFCDTDKLSELCKGKKKIAMVQLAKFMEPHINKA